MPYRTGEDAGFELLPLGPVTLFGCIGGHRTGLFGKSQVRITRHVCIHHQGVLRQGGGYPEFLLRPVDIGETIARLGADQASQPNGGTKYELRVGGLVPAGAGTEGRKASPVPPVAADRKV